MYRPNFCAECGEKVVRLKWHCWTSGRFCDKCAKAFRRYRLKTRTAAIVILVAVGFISGRLGRPAPPPLVIERAANSPLFEQPNNAQPAPGTRNDAQPEGPVYLCGARTKKGLPCSRRVHGPGRCWQHKGKPSIVPQDKLLVKD